MLKEFIEHIQNTTQPLIHMIDRDIDSGSTFAITSESRRPSGLRKTMS